MHDAGMIHGRHAHRVRYASFDIVAAGRAPEQKRQIHLLGQLAELGLQALQRQRSACHRHQHGELAAEYGHAAVFDGKIQVGCDLGNRIDDAGPILADGGYHSASHAKCFLK